MVVIAIIAILLTVVMVSITKARSNSRDKARISNLSNLKVAVRLYAEANGEYPNYPAGVEIGQGNQIDTDLAPYMSQFEGDPLSPETGLGLYGYWYTSALLCNGENRPAVMARTMENSKNDNYEQLCGGLNFTMEETAGKKFVDFISDFEPFYLTAKIAKASGDGGGGGDVGGSGDGGGGGGGGVVSSGGSGGSGGGGVSSGGCSVSLNKIRNPDGSKGCSVNINAYPLTVPSGGGTVEVCWAGNKSSWGDKNFWVQPFGLKNKLNGSRTVFVDTDTTFTNTSKNEHKNTYPKCISSVTVTVESGPDPDPNPDPDPDPETPGLEERFSRVELL